MAQLMGLPQCAEPRLLLCGHAAVALRPVPGAPVAREGAAHQQHRGNPVRVQEWRPGGLGITGGQAVRDSPGQPRTA